MERENKRRTMAEGGGGGGGGVKRDKTRKLGAET